MILQRWFASFLLGTLLLVTGCSTDPASLKQSAPGNVIDLPTGFVHIYPPARMYETRYKYELAAGPYVAELEDAGGIYFRGATGSVRTSVASSTQKEQPIDQVTAREGGIYVPRNATEPARIYFYRGTEKVEGLPASTGTDIAARAAPNAGGGVSAVGGAVGGAVVNSMMNMDKGLIGFLWPVPALREAIRAERR